MSLFTYSAADMSKSIGGIRNGGRRSRREFLMNTSRTALLATAIVYVIYALVLAGIFIIIPLTMSHTPILMKLPLICIGLAMSLWLLRKAIRMGNFLAGRGYSLESDQATLNQAMDNYKKTRLAVVSNKGSKV